mmetsp:Transcript_4922/g.7175  ORF Transcript_4922/g.7175 Transcript_4922/m.7175 type:complete len:92 (+) Transcript_4922:537-812(+)
MGLCLPVPVARVKLKLDDALDGMNRSVTATPRGEAEAVLLVRAGDTLRDDAKDAAKEVSLMGEATPVMTEVRFLGEEEADRNESTDRPSYG